MQFIIVLLEMRIQSHVVPPALPCLSATAALINIEPNVKWGCLILSDPARGGRHSNSRANRRPSVNKLPDKQETEAEHRVPRDANKDPLPSCCRSVSDLQDDDADCSFSFGKLASRRQQTDSQYDSPSRVCLLGAMSSWLTGMSLFQYCFSILDPG